MNDKELEELQDPESWSEDSETRTPTKPGRAVVSVAFNREDFEQVVNQARNQGMKTSEFIRKAALGQTNQQPIHVHVVSTSGQVRTNVPFARPLGSRPYVEIMSKEQDIFTSVSY